MTTTSNTTEQIEYVSHPKTMEDIHYEQAFDLLRAASNAWLAALWFYSSCEKQLLLATEELSKVEKELSFLNSPDRNVHRYDYDWLIQAEQMKRTAETAFDQLNRFVELQKTSVRCAELAKIRAWEQYRRVKYDLEKAAKNENLKRA